MPHRITTPIVGAIIVILKPSTTNAEYIENAFNVHTSIVSPLPGGNTNFTGVVWSVTMPTFLINVTDLDTKQKGMKLKPPTYTASQRNDAKKIVKDNQTLLEADVQKHAKLNAATAQSVIESAGMLLKGSSTHLKFVGTKNTKISGTVKTISADAGGHEWRQLNADGITWTVLRATRGGIKTVAGLPIGHNVTFSSSKIVSDGKPESPWVVYPAIMVS